MSTQRSVLNKTSMIEVIIPASPTGTTFNIPDQPLLRTKKALSLEVYSADDCTKSPSTNGVISTAILKSSYLTLYFSNGQFIQNIPFTRLHPINNGAVGNAFVYDVPELNGQEIDWSKSTIQYTGGSFGASQLSYLINVNYSD